MTLRYDTVVRDLRTSYDAAAAGRDAKAREQFKLDERAAFLDRLRAVEADTLLEIGAGTGQDSVFFRDEGMRVVAVDLSPASAAGPRAWRRTRGTSCTSASHRSRSMRCTR